MAKRLSVNEHFNQAIRDINKLRTHARRIEEDGDDPQLVFREAERLFETIDHLEFVLNNLYDRI